MNSALYKLNPEKQLRWIAMTDTPLVRRSPVAACDCNLARAFELIGDRWMLLILRSALYGMRRFDDFQAELDVPRSVLSSRLAALVDAGIMERREYREDGQRARIEYPLTKMGAELSLPFMAMTAWGDKWLAEGEPPLALHSRSSGQKLRVAMIDERGRLARSADVQIVIRGKAWPAERAGKPRRKIRLKPASQRGSIGVKIEARASMTSAAAKHTSSRKRPATT
jgi:DNA-binding HxlR family transcriptional regulator